MNQIYHVVIFLPELTGEIPGLYSRLIAGKPFLSWCILSAVNAEHVSKVWLVSSEEEYQEIAQRFGAESLHLSEEKENPDSGFRDQLSGISRIHEIADCIIFLNPLTPLISSKTIDRMVIAHQERPEVPILSAIESSGSTGSDSQNPVQTIFPNLFGKDPSIPDSATPTDAVLICKKSDPEIMLNNSDQSPVLYQINPLENLKVSSYKEWWVAEKSLQRKTICFHFVGNRSLGLGHVFRTLTLADRLIDHQIVFLCNSESILGSRVIQSRHYPVKIVSPGEELDYLSGNKPDLLVNDILDTDAEFIGAIRRLDIPTVNFEDLGPGSEICDCVINEMYDHHQRNDGKVYNGVGYCCLREEFFSVFPKAVSDRVQNILILFGGTDPNRLSLNALKWFDGIPDQFSITLIAGLGFKEHDELQNLAENSPHKVEIVTDTRIISRYMADADIAITSGGRTVFELASLGIPMIVMAQNEREMTHTFACSSNGVIFMGPGTEVEGTEFKKVVSDLIHNQERRQEMRDNLLNSDVLSGVNRVLEILKETLAISEK